MELKLNLRDQDLEVLFLEDLSEYYKDEGVDEINFLVV